MMVLLAATKDTSGLVAVSLLFLIAGFVAVGALWYLMVLRPGREARRAAEDRPPGEDQSP